VAECLVSLLLNQNTTNMKKLFISASAGLLCVFLSCNSKESAEKNTMSDQTQKNLDASHTVSKAFETGDVSAIDSVVASDFVDHTDRGEKNRDSLKAMITMMHATNKDMKMEITKELADNDYVFSWMRFTGTSDGSMGMPKGPYDMQAIQVIKFKDGKIVEHWEFMQPAEMMKMMGQQPGMDKMMNDTTKKKM
jgi:predicted SnoaL-like aldol condensation-catalyzing enzyme